MSYHTLCVSMCVTKFLLSWSHGFININYFVEKNLNLHYILNAYSE